MTSSMVEFVEILSGRGKKWRGCDWYYLLLTDVAYRVRTTDTDGVPSLGLEGFNETNKKQNYQLY